jgi:N-acetylglutamate synthase-like GNAT family acetyltransferase
MHIRKTNIADLGSVSKLLELCYSTLMKSSYSPDILDAAIPVISKARPELLSSGTYYVSLSREGRIIGCGGWTANSPNQGENNKSDTGQLRYFATHPDHIKSGIGRSIFDSCKTQALTRSIKNFECISSLNAEDFYKSLGFSTVERVSIPLNNGVSFPCLLMKYTL